MTNDAAPRRLRRKKTGQPRGTMTLVEHLQELRRRLIVSLIAVVAGTILGYIWYQNAPSITLGNWHLRIPTLGDILREPYCAIPASARADFSGNGTCRLLATGPFDMFMLRLKVGALAGTVFSSPVWLGQLWRFITPGLYRKEKRFTAIFVTLAVTLFVTGAVFAYYILSVGLGFLLTIGDQTQTAGLTGLTYYNFVLGLLLIFGVSFEVPLIITMLNIIGVLSYDAVKDKRRMIIVIIFVFAAVATPTQDPFSMLLLALALTLLVEISFQSCRLRDRKRRTERPEWMDLNDEQASPLHDQPQPVSQPQPIQPTTSFDDVV